ncbi:hypothetical protein Cni_G00523 [Canna indica]|uniref:Uncharacterized protein n=1 Tax=Canna indica TaxID=4628 RepID=A0AAQ3JMV9_9LILI|nr:hypothetical protein Cni_G00523 [Canna indica]
MAGGDEVGDVLLEEPQNGLLLLPDRLYPRLYALHGVLAAPHPRQETRQALRYGETTQEQTKHRGSSYHLVENFLQSKLLNISFAGSNHQLRAQNDERKTSQWKKPKTESTDDVQIIIYRCQRKGRNKAAAAEREILSSDKIPPINPFNCTKEIKMQREREMVGE